MLLSEGVVLLWKAIVLLLGVIARMWAFVVLAWIKGVLVSGFLLTSSGKEILMSEGIKGGGGSLLKERKANMRGRKTWEGEKIGK